MPRAVRIVAVVALHSGVVHHALQEGVSLDAVFMGRAVVPELRRLLAIFGFKALPELCQIHTRLIADGPGILGPRRLARHVTGEANVNRAVTAQTRRIDNVGHQRFFRMRLAGAVTALAGDVQFDPALGMSINPGTVAAGT